MKRHALGICIWLCVLCTLSFGQMIVKNSDESELIRVTHEGYVGIGSTEPEAKLWILGSRYHPSDNYAGSAAAIDLSLTDEKRHFAFTGVTKMPLTASSGILDRVGSAGHLYISDQTSYGSENFGASGLLGSFLYGGSWDGIPGPAMVGSLGNINLEYAHWSDLAKNATRIAVMGYNPNLSATDYGLYISADQNYISGRVGIGKTTPDAKLVVAGSTNYLGSSLALTLHAYDVNVAEDLRHVCISGTTKMPVAGGALNLDRMGVSGHLWVHNNETINNGEIAGATGILGMYASDGAWGGPAPTTMAGVVGNINMEYSHWTDLAKNSNRIAILGYNPNSKPTDYGLYVTAVQNYLTGRLGIGTIPDAAYALDVAGVIRANNVSPSDQRLKTNIQKIDNALDKLAALQGVTFEWLDQNMGSGTQLGLIAQQVETTLPEVVTQDSKGIKAIAYYELTALLIEAVKELKTEVEALKK